MNGPQQLGQEYTGKHRRASGPGVLPPAWGARAASSSRPADARPGPGATPLPEPGFRPEMGQRSDVA